MNRPHWYDQKKVTVDDLRLQQDFDSGQLATAQAAGVGTGIIDTADIDAITIFDSNSLSVSQAAWETSGDFDGRGILDSTYRCSDRENGKQIQVILADARVNATLPCTVTIIGTDFADALQYEHLEFKANGTQVTYAAFKTVINICFQNFRGNTDTSVDGIGSRNLGGSIVVREADSLLVSLDAIVANQTRKPEMVFGSYKLYDPLSTLNTVLTEALRDEYDVADLDIDTDVDAIREFSEGATTDIIYGQKFRANSNNIQAVDILLALASGSSWSGQITVGIRKLQTSETYAGSTRYLPDNQIGFDPESESLSEVSLTQADMLLQGIVLGSDMQIVRFPFSQTPVSNPDTSQIEADEWYCLTIRRSGSTATGTLQIPEATSVYSGSTGYQNVLAEDFFSGGGRFTVFGGQFWSDVTANSTWYRIWGDSVKISGGSMYDSTGQIAQLPLTDTNTQTGLVTQLHTRGIDVANPSTGASNYILAQSTVELITPERHPVTGDSVASRERIVPAFSGVDQSSAESLLDSDALSLFTAHVVDENPRANPTITGTSYYPGLIIGNRVDILLPPADLLSRNVVGSILTPNTAKPAIRYRIVSATAYTDGYGDVDGDGEINIDDLSAIDELDGYSLTMAGGTYSQSEHVNLLKSGEIEQARLLRASLTTDDLIDVSDEAALSAFLTAGTGFPHGLGEFSRVRLYVEPMSDPAASYDSSGNSTLLAEDADTDLLSTFSGPVDWQIDAVDLWRPEHVAITDMRRLAISNRLTPPDLDSDPRSGGKNGSQVPGDLFLGGQIRNLDNSLHKLDYERVLIDIELPDGNTEDELNIFDVFIDGKMRFSDGTLVPSSALADNQILFEVQVSSYAKNLGFGVDGYTDYSGLDDSADEAVGTYIDQSTGLLRIKAYNIVNNLVLPEIRTRVYVVCNLKKAGWRNAVRTVSATELQMLLS